MCNQAHLVWVSCFNVACKNRFRFTPSPPHTFFRKQKTLLHPERAVLWLHFARSPCRHGQGTQRSALGSGASFLWRQRQSRWSKSRKFGKPEQQASVSVCFLCVHACVCVLAFTLPILHAHFTEFLHLIEHFSWVRTFVTCPFKSGCLLLTWFLFYFCVCVFNLD